MKDFMLIFKGMNYNDMGLTPEELQPKLQKWKDWTDKLKEDGILKGGEALTSKIRTVKGIKQIVTDSISADLKEVIGGYFIISAMNIEEATKIAADYPNYELPNSGVEIREIVRYKS